MWQFICGKKNDTNKLPQSPYIYRMIKEVRAFFNIPQETLADYLGVTRSHLSMAESGFRQLSGIAYESLSKFYQAIPAAEVVIKHEKLKEAINIQQEKHSEKVSQKLKRGKLNVSMLEYDLSKMKEKQEQAIRILESLENIKAIAKPFDEGMIFIIETAAFKLQQETAEDVQLKLLLRIAGFKGEIAFLETL